MEGAKPHSTLLVESVAMRSVMPPAPTYTPNLPKETITSGGLSDAQLEAVVYAGQAHEDFLDTGARRGFFIGDGTGVGKGREVAGIILDNWRQGRKKAVWVTEKQKLFDDARRDMSGVGGDPDTIFRHGAVKASESIDRKAGVLFTTYSTIRSGEKKQTAEGGKTPGKSRVQQLLDWLGDDFDGVIAFDESHNMRQATDQKAARGKKKASQQALAGLELQRRLPKARVVYVSATGATEVSNLVYADRLGLWGPKTSFTDSGKFIAEIDAAGVSAMELVARDLKQLGQYISRSLSFEGVTYDRITHQLTDAQTAIYNRLAEAWQSVLTNIEAALGITGGDQSPLAKAAAMSQFWGTHQRFFNQVITSMQVPSVLERIDANLKDGHAVVLQLVNTMEAAMNRALADREEGEELEELDLTPREQIMQYVKNAFPVHQFELTTDENGTEIVRIVKDKDGNPVVSREALAMRDALLKDLADIKVPDAPLDQIIRHFGTDKVAEITGRGLRVVPNDHGKLIEEKRGDSAVKADMRAFMDDKKPILIFSDAGGTGFSFHSDLGARNQRRRHHYLLQAGWRADKAVQGFGRTHRTNEANQPNYVLVETNLKAQRRFISSIARRLDQLGALTKGQRSASGQQMFSERDNLESVYAKRAVRKFLMGVYNKQYPDISFEDVIEGQMGFRLRRPEEMGGISAAIDQVSVPQFLNRMLSLRVASQDTVFEHFSDILDGELEYAKATGTLDTGVKTLKALKLSKISEDTIYTDERTKAETKLVKLKATYPHEFTEWKEAERWIPRAEGEDKRVIGYFLRPQEKSGNGRPYIVVQDGTRTEKGGAVVPHVKAISPVGTRYDMAIDDFDKKHRVSKNQLEAAWQPYIDAYPKTYDSTEHLISGMILPVWDRMHGQFVNVVQAVTDDGHRLVGRLIAQSNLSKTLKAFGLSPAAKMKPAQIRDAILGGDQVELANGWILKKAVVSGEDRIEVVPSYMSRDEATAIKAYGGFVEVIQWRDRAFMPKDDLGKLAGLLKDKPAAEIKPAGGRADEPAFHRAYHGSPHDFDQFTVQKVGTGEGAQAYGWGLYFAGKKEIAQWYRDGLTPAPFKSAAYLKQAREERVKASLRRLADYIKNKADKIDLAADATPTAWLGLMNAGTRFGMNYHSYFVEDVAAEARRILGSQKKRFNDAAAPEAIRSAVDRVLAAEERKGRLYEVDLAPSDDQYLQWDKPLSQQSEQVQAALKSAKHRVFARAIEENWLGKKMYYELAHALGGQRQVNTEVGKVQMPYSDHEEASRYLNAIGVPGIKYADAASRNDARLAAAEQDIRLYTQELEIAREHGAGPEKIAEIEAGLEGARRRAQQSFNYVVFDDSHVSIAAKYRLGGEANSTASIDELRGVARRLAKDWKNGPKLEITATPAEWPFDAPADAKGAFWRGKVYLARHNIADAKDAQFTIFHEVFGHYGLRRFFGRELDPILRDLWTRNANLRRVATKWMAQNAKPEGWTQEDYRNQAIEEALSDMAGRGEKIDGLRKLLAKIQTWLRANGFDAVADFLESLSDAEAMSVLAMARRYVTNTEPDIVPPLEMAAGQAQYQRLDEIPDYSRKGLQHSDEQGQFDFDAPATVSRQPEKAASKDAGSFLVRVEPAKRGELHIGFDKLDTTSKAAHAFAALRKAPREYFQIILTDKNDKPIASAMLFAGTLAQTAVYPREILALAYQTPGAARLWMAHNHPSGVPSPSQADELLTRSIREGLGPDIGIRFAGHIIIAGNKARWMDTHPGSGIHDRESHTFELPPAARKFTVPLMERVIKKSSIPATSEMRSPDEIRNYLRQAAFAEPTLVFLDAQHRVIGHMPMPLEQLKPLRTGSLDTGAARLFRIIGLSNPAAAIYYTPHMMDAAALNSMTENLAGALDKMMVRFLDAFTKNGDSLISLAERGLGATPTAFFSRGAIEPGRRRESLFNAATRIPTQLLGIDKLTSKSYDFLLEKIGGLLPETVKAGMGHDYGIDEAVSDRRDLMFAHQRSQLRDVQGTIGKLMNLTRAESRVAYAWMNDRNGDELLEQLPEESRVVLRDLKTRVDALSREAVRLGQLSADAYERNKMAYLHRSYRKYELDATKQDRAARGRAVRILGDQYKGRGMTDAAAMTKIKAAAPEWWGRKLREGKGDAGLVGQMFVRFERRQNRGEGVSVLPGVEESTQPGKLREVAYWPAAEPVPSRYAGWTRDAGEWKVTGTKGDKLIMWRDFTLEERTRMGEIDEVRFAVAKTMQQMIHDIEAGKYLEWLANNHSRGTDNLPQGAKVVDAKESLFRTFTKDEWVQVPDVTIGGTQTKKYGKLAGLYIPGPIWNDVRQIVNHRFSPLGETYATLLRAWKISKTALSPAVHLNNVMANVVMADWHDILAADLVRALRVTINSSDPANKKLLETFEDNGGTQGMYALTELQREQLKPLIEALEREVAQAEGAKMVNAAGVVQALLAGKYREAAAAAAGGKAAQLGKKAAGLMIDLYQAEDTVFRLAAFLKAKAEGKTDAEAGKVARKSFLDYSINAPWVQMMRATVFPFISFVYRAAPMMAETYARKPWKMLKLWIILGGLNALGYSLGGGDEDKERKLLAKEKQGRVLGILPPKLIRMPWNDRFGSPVFLDVRRFIPVGDVFDLGQTHAALPWTPVAVPGGPLALALELYANRSQFTGKEITHGSDTAREVAGKVFDHIYKAVAPNLPFLPGTYSFQDIADAGKGKTDAFGREKSLPQALGSSVGIKVGGYPADVAKLGIKVELDNAKREVTGEIQRLAREYARKGISREEFEQKKDYQVEKLKKLEKDAGARLN